MAPREQQLDNAPTLLALYHQNAGHLTPRGIECASAFYTLLAHQEILRAALAAR